MSEFSYNFSSLDRNMSLDLVVDTYSKETVITILNCFCEILDNTISNEYKVEKKCLHTV